MFNTHIYQYRAFHSIDKYFIGKTPSLTKNFIFFINFLIFKIPGQRYIDKNTEQIRTFIEHIFVFFNRNFQVFYIFINTNKNSLFVRDCFFAKFEQKFVYFLKRKIFVDAKNNNCIASIFTIQIAYSGGMQKFICLLQI